LLAAKLDVYAIDMDEDNFISKCKKEALELSESPFGCALLGNLQMRVFSFNLITFIVRSYFICL
jgi:hypothetical protein